MKCDICGFAWDSVRILYHNDTPVIYACVDCIPVHGDAITHVYRDGVCVWSVDMPRQLSLFSMEGIAS